MNKKRLGAEEMDRCLWNRISRQKEHAFRTIYITNQSLNLTSP